MDDFESRLSDGLGRQARRLPAFDNNLDAVKRRGRNRRWAARSAGAFGALAILGGGLAVTLATRDGGKIQVGTGDEGSDEVAIVSPTATPTPTPTSEVPPTTQTAPQPTPPDIASPSDDVRLVVATGWGAGLVANTGDLYAAVSCCGDGDVEWHTQGDVRNLQGAVGVRDDLRGGLVTASGNSLYWLQSDGLADVDEPMVIADIASANEGDVIRLNLWDIIDFDNAITVLYSTQSINADGTAGQAALYAVELGANADPELLDSTQWTDDDLSGAFTWASGAWLPDGGHMSLKSYVGGPNSSCEWIEFEEFDEQQDGLYESPYPAPADPANCPHDSIAAATINDEGLLAVSTRFRSSAPELEVWDRAGNPQATFLLPPTEGDDGYWSELDMVDNQVLISRGQGMDAARWAELDETYLIDVSRPDSEPRATAYWGAPTFVRSDISTHNLTAIAEDDPLWFLRSSRVPDPKPTPDPDVEPTPDPSSDGEPTPTAVDPQQELVGDNGCFREICIGDPIDEAFATFAGFGPTDDLPPLDDGEHTYAIAGTAVFTLGAEDGLLVSLRYEAVAEGPQNRPFFNPTIGEETLTMRDVRAALGEPVETFRGDQDGAQVIWLHYEFEDFAVSYGYVELSDESPPEIDDTLPINAYWARATR